jgi:hypothetical protein
MQRARNERELRWSTWIRSRCQEAQAGTSDVPRRVQGGCLPARPRPGEAGLSGCLGSASDRLGVAAACHRGTQRRLRSHHLGLSRWRSAPARAPVTGASPGSAAGSLPAPRPGSARGPGPAPGASPSSGGGRASDPAPAWRCRPRASTGRERVAQLGLVLRLGLIRGEGRGGEGGAERIVVSLKVIVALRVTGGVTRILLSWSLGDSLRAAAATRRHRRVRLSPGARDFVGVVSGFAVPGKGLEPATPEGKHPRGNGGLTVNWSGKRELKGIDVG